MRIFLLLPGLTIGGMERAAVTLANALSVRGHDVTVATYGKGDDPLASELNNKVLYINKGLKPHPLMKRIPWIRHVLYDDGMWETRTSAERLYRYNVGKEDFDVEIAFFRGLSIKVLSAKRKSGDSPRRLAWVHNDFTQAPGWSNNFNGLDKVRKAYESYDKVICVSEQAKHGFIKTIGDTGNLITIYNILPIDEIKIKSVEDPTIKIPKHKFNVVLVGRLDDGAKGQRRFIDIIAALQKEGIDVGLTLVGDGPDHILIDRHIEVRNSQDFVYMTGSQNNPYPYIRQADLLVCASYYEGYNLTVAEALILGTPVMSTHCTGPVEILDNGKYGLIVENSYEGLMHGMRKIAMNPEILEHYKMMAKERMDFFNEELAMTRLEMLFKVELSN